MIGLYDVAAEDFRIKYITLFVHHKVLQDSPVWRYVKKYKQGISRDCNGFASGLARFSG
jgi:hypothetical protein